jgi:prevent-host-death family protein
MTKMTTTQLKAELGEAISRVQYGGEMIEICRRGKPVAWIVPIDTARSKREAEEDRLLLNAYKKAKGRKTIPLEQAARRYGL